MGHYLHAHGTGKVVTGVDKGVEVGVSTGVYCLLKKNVE